MRILISGGAKNGKSIYAQKISKAMSVKYDVPLYYVATMKPADEEDESRIKRHIQERAGWGFTTIEEPRRLTRIFDGIHKLDKHAKVALENAKTGNSNVENASTKDINSNGVFLVDSLTALLGNNMFSPDGSMNLNCFEDIRDDIYKFSQMATNIVIVSDSIGCDGMKFDEVTENYKRCLARLEGEIASYYDRVTEVSVGRIIDFK